MRRGRAVLLVVLLAVWASPVAGDLYQVSIDLSSLGGSDFQLQAALYDNSGVIGDSWVRMDNVALGSAVDDFESGTLGAFDPSLNPSSVAAAAGNLHGAGGFVMRIDEDPAVWPTYAYRDYLDPDGSTLTFDLETTLSDAEGFFGKDEFVLAILDPVTLDPLFAGLTGFGDILAINADGFQHSGEAVIGVVPLPGAVLLGLIGLGASALGLARQRGSLV